MKTTRRNGCFETNSSSSHSISISPGNFHNRAAALSGLDKSFPVTASYTDCNGVEHKDCVVLTGGEFGWGREDYNDTLTKANYIAQHFSECRDTESYKLFESVILKVSGAKELVIDAGGGYIDHQSTGTANDALESEDVLWDYLFNPGSVLIIDNDNN